MGLTRRSMVDRIRGILQKYPELKASAQCNLSDIRVHFGNSSDSEFIGIKLDDCHYDIKTLAYDNDYTPKYDDDSIILVQGDEE